ncbi:P63C domain-containing protein [bacterium]|nr:P63C domain-containing protein [bacterium]
MTTTNKSTTVDSMKQKQDLPYATHDGELHISASTIPCAVLNDGRRVLTQQGFLQAVGRAAKAKAGQGAAGESKMPAFLAANNLRKFISDELQKACAPIIFKPLHGGYRGIAFGYPAELLPMVCNVFIDAEDGDVLLASQKHIAKKCKLLIRGLATVGIIALVDEATGYQEVRDRLALQKILAKYITDYRLPWTKRFPDEFYQQLFRLNNWRYSGMSVKRPIRVAQLTNDLVYERLAPGVLDELKRLTPKDDKGRRKHKYFQHLTEDHGCPALERHLLEVIALMRAAPTWSVFHRLIQRSLPKPSLHPVLPGTEEPIDVDEI